MSIAQIEQAIVDRLKDAIKGVVVEGFPEKPSEYKLMHLKGAILVSYAGSSWSEPLATDAIVQKRKVIYDITVVMRHLREHDGAYQHLDNVRSALTGFAVNGCSKMYPVNEDFVDETNGIWTYRVSFAMTMYDMELEDKDSPVLLKKITAQDEYAVSVVQGN